MNLKYIGAALDYSGYGEANRHDIAALHSAGVDVWVELTRHCLEISDFGKLGELVRELEKKTNQYDFKILHTTPNIYNRFIEPGKYHIGRVFWETDTLPEHFAHGAQMCDEIWTGSEFNAQAIRNAGVTKPIYIIPEAIDTFLPEVRKYEVPNANLFNFYSIFEWTERKNPAALLEAYWREFEHTEGVGLVLKTYVDNFTQDKKNEVLSEARKIRNNLGLSRYAPIFFYTELMDRRQIYRFHATFDCFVSAHRGEGWGIPQMEALLSEKPVISTACGGIHEHLTNKEDALLIPYTLVPLETNSRNQQWYTSDQKWADIKIDDLREAMRWVFDHKEEAKEMGKNGAKTCKTKFSLETVGNLMLKRLCEIPLAH